MRGLLGCLLTVGMLYACGPLGARIEESINEPTAPTSTVEVMAGYLTFPYLVADAGNFLLQAGDEIRVSWEGAPEGAASYEMRYLPADGSPPTTLPFNGGGGQPIQASWLVPQGASGCLEGSAIFGGGEEVHSACAQIYSGDLPPDSVCSLQVVGRMPANVYQSPDEGSPRTAGLGHGVYLKVIGKSQGGWYLVELGGLDGEPEDLNHPSGWIRAEEGAKLSGPCDEIPLLEPSNPIAPPSTDEGEPATSSSEGASAGQDGSATPTATVMADLLSCTNEAAFLEDLTVPDGSVFSPGEAFTKAWRVKNAGTCTWTLNYGLVFFDGDRMGAYADLPMPSVVEPGESVDLHVQMTAPGRSGNYQGNWLLRDAQGRTFGIGSGSISPFWVNLKVIANLATPMATSPAAGICPEMDGEMVTMTIRMDMPDPRCMIVHPDQTLRVVNAKDLTLSISLGRLSATITPGDAYIFPEPFGHLLQPGVHYLGVDPCCGGTIWLQE